MDKSDIVEFSQVWSGGFEVQGKTASDIVIEMAFNALSRHDLGDIRKAMMTHIQTSNFAPKPSDINEIISGDPESQKLKAWTMVESAIRRVGGYESVVFDDPGVMVVIDEMGGWTSLCDVTDSELPFKRNEFVKRMAQHIHTPPTEYPKRLSGIVEQQNQEQYPDAIPKPLLIGDATKARLVLENGGKPRLIVTKSEEVTGLKRVVEIGVTLDKF